MLTGSIVWGAVWLALRVSGAVDIGWWVVVLPLMVTVSLVGAVLRKRASSPTSSHERGRE